MLRAMGMIRIRQSPPTQPWVNAAQETTSRPIVVPVMIIPVSSAMSIVLSQNLPPGLWSLLDRRHYSLWGQKLRKAGKIAQFLRFARTVKPGGTRMPAARSGQPSRRGSAQAGSGRLRPRDGDAYLPGITPQLASFLRGHKNWVQMAIGPKTLREAGGVVTGRDGGEFDLRNPHFVSAAGTKLHHELLRVLSLSEI